MKAATLIALFLVGLCAASQYGQRQDSSNENDNNNRQQQRQKPQPFRAGNEYTYTYNGQIASGLDVSGPNNAPSASDEPQQKAVTRMQAQAKITFESDQRATLRLRNINLGQLNDQIESPHQVQSMKKFERKELDPSKKEKLEMPLQFNYQDGVVQSIQFHPDDSTWSKNIKRGVLNLLQLNLKQRQVPGSQQQQSLDSSEQQYIQQEENDRSPYKTFTLPEITVEGECQTTYSISKNKRQQSNNQDDNQSQERQQQQQEQQQSGKSASFNVTKTINFKKCNQISDVAYGFQNQQQQQQCAKCKQQQQQQQQSSQQQQQCSEECDPKEVKEQKLDRTTVMRFVLNGENPSQEFAIKRTELISQYVYKNLRADTAAHSSAMQTIVAAELVFQSVQQKQQQQGPNFRPNSNSNEKDTLLYDNEFEIETKKFFMFGDEGSHAPFAKWSSSNKAEQAQQMIRKLSQAASNKLEGIEPDVALEVQRLVDLLRMCTARELQTIFDQTKAAQQSSSSPRGADQHKAPKTVSLLTDCLALAGTRNTISVLAQKIQNGELEPEQAAQSLKRLSGLPAPSDKQVDIILQLCQNEKVQKHAKLKKTCLLTAGSMVAELCQQKTQKGDKSQSVFGAQSGFNSHSQCTKSKKSHYKRTLLNEYETARNMYQRIVALKALGNAGIDTSAQAIEQIANDRRQSPLVRISAIDALRRLRHQMPRQIQRSLLPILQNTREQPAVRMAAFSMIIQSSPEQPVVDQVAYTLAKESNQEVKSLVYSALKALSKSKVPAQQQMAKHLKNALKLTNVDEQTLQSSRFHSIPIYSDEQQEGAFLNLVSVFATRNGILPNHMTAMVNTMLNDEFETNTLKVALTQQNIEQWFEGVVESVLDPHQQSEQNNGMTRGHRQSTSSYNEREQELRKIFKGLKIQRRQSPYQQYSQEDDEEQQNSRQNSEQSRQQDKKQPFAMISVRIADVDTEILPLSRQSMPRCLKKIADGQFSLAECLKGAIEKKSMHSTSIGAMNINEKSAKIPTSIGIPLRVVQSTPILASLEAQVSGSTDRSEGIKVQFNLHPSACLVHVQKMQTWSPLLATGVQSTRSAELNIPIVGNVQINSQDNIKLTLKAPPPRTRLLGVHTLPTTYTRDFDSNTHQLRKPQVKAVKVPQLEQLQRDVDKIVGKHSSGMPFRMVGHLHRPADPTDYRQIVQLAMATENHLHIKYEPNPNSLDEAPQEVVLRVQAGAYGQSQTRGPSFANFYRNNQLDESDEQEYDGMDTKEQRRSKLNSYVNSYQGQTYKHDLKVTIETRGGRKQAKAEAEGSATCDAKFKFCHIKVNAQRTPMMASENSDWSMNGNLEIVRPDTVSNVQQLQQSQNEKNRKLVVQGDAQWGSDHKQTISFRIRGEKAHTKQWRQQVDSHQGPQQKFQEKQAAFINKLDIAAEYKLGPQAQNVFQRAFEVVKGYGSFWNTKESQNENGRNGQLSATIVIDPLTQQHANISVKSPSQSVKIETMELPMKMRPFPLVRQNEKSSHSISQLFSRLSDGMGRAECSVDGKRVETFDQVLYKAPIGKCYSVLAKDCSDEQEPKFVVMMKTLTNGQDKKIKVITPRQTVECKPDNSDGQKKLQCYVNGERIEANDNQQRGQRDQEQQNSRQQQQRQIVEYNNDEQTDATINVKGVQVRFGCWGSQGCKQQKAWIKLSSKYKDAQCGLCGHYDDQADGELRLANNEQTRDLPAFHRSYTLRQDDDREDECNDQDQERFYTGNKQKFRQMGWESDEESQDPQEDDYDLTSSSQKKKSGRQNQLMNGDDSNDNEDEDDSQWKAGAYHSDESSSEEDPWGRQGSNKRWRQKKNGRQVMKKKSGNNQQDEEAPIEVTKVSELSHKICFSVQPVKECPQGTVPRSKQSDQSNAKRSVPFACLPRSDPQTRRMQRQARDGKIVQIPNDQQPAFVENFREPTSCVAY